MKLFLRSSMFLYITHTGHGYLYLYFMDEHSTVRIQFIFIADWLNVLMTCFMCSVSIYGELPCVDVNLRRVLRDSSVRQYHAEALFYGTLPLFYA
jgi:hypothetical protein